jgi:hypothetical protein
LRLHEVALYCDRAAENTEVSLEILIGIVVGLLILVGVVFFARRARETPMRRRDISHDYDARGDYSPPE